MLKPHQKELIDLIKLSQNKLIGLNKIYEYLENNKSETEDVVIMSELIKIDCWIFRYASISIQENKSFILDNIEKIHIVLRESMKKDLNIYKDKDFLIQLQNKIDLENESSVYKITSNIFDYCHKSFFADKEFILKLKHVSLTTPNFKKISENLRDDKEIVNLHIDNMLKDDRIIYIEHFSKRLQNDKELILKIMKKQNAYEISLPKDSLLYVDRDIIKEAVTLTKSNILNIPIDFLNDSENFKYLINVLMDSGNYVFKIGEPRNKVVNYLLKTKEGSKLLKNNEKNFFKNDMVIELIHNIFEKELMNNVIEKSKQKSKRIKY